MPQRGPQEAPWGEANPSCVNRRLKLLLASLTATALVGGVAAPGRASPLMSGDANNFLFAGGGTPLTNGVSSRYSHL